MVRRCLAKSPADRFRTVAEFEKALAGATLPLLARIPMGRARAVVYGALAAIVLGVAAIAGSLLRPDDSASIFESSTTETTTPNAEHTPS